MSIKLLRYHIIESIKFLASDGNIQLSYYPEFVCKGDEIANLLGDWLLLYQEKTVLENNDIFSQKELMQIISLDNDISMLPPEEFSDYAITHSDKWIDIREKAKKILLSLNEKYSTPDIWSI